MKREFDFHVCFRWFILPLILVLFSFNVTAQYKYIVGHPRDMTVEKGYEGLVTFSVDLLPGTEAKYQWYYQPVGEPSPLPIKEAIGPVLEMPLKEAIERKLVDAPVWCEVEGDGWMEKSLDAYLYLVYPRTAIAKHPEDVTEEEGFVGEVNYGVDLLPGTEFKEIYWYIRYPGSVWKEYATGQQIVFPIKEPLNYKLFGTAFRCVVVHSGGEDVSNTAYLWIKQKKKYIVMEPVDVTKKEGFVGEIYFNIKTEGYGLYYQWQIQYPGEIWKDLTGAEKPELYFPVKEPLSMKLDGTAFRCVVMDKEKYVEYSEPAYLHVEQARKYILLDPQDVTEKQGFVGELFFYIKYEASVPIGFQWQIKKPGGSVWEDILYQTKPELYYPIKDPLTPDWSGTGFRCVVFDKEGWVEYSNPAYLYVTLYETYILSHPRNVTQCEGYAGNIVFRIKPVEGITLTFQWQLMRPDESKWTDIPGATETGYIQTFEELPLTYNKYQYRCKVMDTYGGVEFSNVAFLYVNAKPKIVSHPVSQTKLLGEAVTFNVSASGYKPLTYQWQKDEVNISGASSYSYSIAPIAADDSGYYRCVVSNVCLPSGVVSNAAKLTVDVPKYTDGWFTQGIVTTKDLTDIKFTGDFSGWVSVENSSLIYKTNDGGDEWTTVTLGVSEPWRALSTTDANHVWVAGGDKIMYTTNAGTSWTTWDLTSLPALTTPVELYGLCFTDSLNGWAVGDNGLIIKTADGGANWSIQNSGDVGGFKTDAHLEALHFVNADTGWVAGSLGKILVTLNAGASWAIDTAGIGSQENLKDIYFTDDQNGWAAGENNKLLKTTNGGTTWTNVATPASVDGEDLNGVHFADSENGWIVAGNGLILRTNDGGTSWYSQPSGTTNSLNAIDFADYNNGWVVGDLSTILRTAYSGCLLPMVSLYEDKAFCASVNYELVADSFAKNADCSYLWNTESTDGSIMVTESGKYYVRVTSVCGKEVSDTVHIELYPLPDAFAGNDDAICDGDSVQLLATGGVLYSWNNGSYLNDPEVQNPKAGPPIGTTDFIVTVTDDNECQNTDTVAITVYPVPTSTFTAPDYVCGTGVADITYTGSASAYANFYWDFDDGATIQSGDSIGPYEVSWDPEGIRTISLVAEENGCSSDTTFHTVSVNVIPSSDFDVVSAVCGEDTITITYMGEASAGADYQWGFDGGTIISGAGQGPYEVSWATTGTKTISLYVTENNCTSSTTTVDIDVYPVPTSTFTAPDYVCGTGQATITYTGSASAAGTFDWDFDDGSTIHSGSGIGPYQISWNPEGARTISLVVEENGCYSGMTSDVVSVNVIPSSDFELVGRVCGDDTVTITYQGAATAGASYTWSFGGGDIISGTGQGPYEVSWATPGNKTVSLSVTEDNCSSSTTSNQITVAYPFEGEEICLVTIDLETGKNMVIWEKTEDAGIASYNIYRESTSAGIYDFLANIPYDNLSVYVDKTSQPEIKSYKYRISVIDTCGNESPPSFYHKTMLLTSNLGPNAINLSWTEYVVEDGSFGFIKYLIYRGDAPNNLSIIDSIASDNTLYPDYNPPDDTMYYRIAGVKKTACYPSVSIGKKAGTGPYSHSLSNLEDNRLQSGTGIKDLLSSKYNFNVYPNPFRQETRLSYNLNEVANVKIEIFNLLGARVADIVNERQLPGEFTYNLTEADIGSTEGIYYIRFTVDGQSMVRKLIMAR
ncbi:MAG: hypothetical protein AMS27_11470 [Bacteroides sp. SM23_62_1]|nr:MAG: hypothetical protein AMS27_11470 [Bacteroides sp. SM23_62_1]